MRNLIVITIPLLLLSCNSLNRQERISELETSTNTENIIVNELQAIKLSKEIIDKISVNDIVYAELAESGAMGNAGGIMMYVFEDKELVMYETNLFDEENLYSEAGNLLLKHQNKLEYENLEKGELLFDYHYGGMGNHVLVSKKITLEKEDGYFTFNTEDDNYEIYCSVTGVFNSVVYSLSYLKSN